MTSKRVISGAFAGAALLLGTACAASVSAGKFMDEEDVERQISESLTKETGTKPDKIDCPGDLKGKVDATMQCTMTSGGSEYAVNLTVTKVEGLNIGFHYDVPDAPKDGSTPTLSVDETQLEQQVSSMLEKQVGQRPDRIDCPGSLAGKIGESMRCTLTAGTDELGLTVTVTEIEGTTVNFDIEVDDKIASPAG